MTENYDHYISRHIRRVYCRRLVSPILYLIFLMFLWASFPLYDILFPQELDSSEDLSAYTDHHSSYIEATFTDLYFTGYTNESLGRTAGYYYYAQPSKSQPLVIVLLSPSTCEEGLPVIESVRIRGQVLKENPAYHSLLERLAEDLDWTKQGIGKSVSPYFVSEPAFLLLPSVILMTVYFATGMYALLHIVFALIYIQFPVCSPACRQLGRFGKARELLSQAETELATLPQLATEDMFITEHYFIVLAGYGAAIIPIQEILWIYKHSTLHKILWYHFSISYTLHITARKHLHFHCPKNMKSDIDGIMDYLAEANHEILVGFSEENRLKVHGTRSLPVQLEKILTKLKNTYKKQI
ncbi:MAG: hypothetical protein HFH50_04620 [Lachnospiraceae bacterium]|jgi:hypothetical protein|nr:hypothetical protein [Lachnospiraceae bacterium]MCI9058550.1 hypothetical protein [Lachnospiraceae bacterium]GFI30735.1 hypothetical protein IMSAGC013_02128 [Lachnospiraceae bacterium]